MTARHRPRPPLLLRIAIVIGCTTFLLGLAGAIALVLIRDESPASSDTSTRVGLVRLAPAPPPSSVAVEVRWEVEGEPSRVAAAPSEAGDGMWTVVGAPHGVPVEIEVFRLEGEGRRVFVTRVPAVLAGERIIDVPMPQ